MDHKKYPDEDTVNFQIRSRTELIVAIPFDKNKPVLISACGRDRFELVSHFENAEDMKNKYFCIYAKGGTAVWFCKCPNNYRDIKDKEIRIAAFY